MTQQVTDALDDYRYADAARTLYDFAWNEFCSFYVEMTKARFAVPEQRADGPARAGPRARRAAAAVAPDDSVPHGGSVAAAGAGGAGARLDATARSRSRDAAESVCIAPWPIADAARQDAAIEAQFADFQAVLGAVREIRQRQNIPLKEELDLRGPLRRGDGRAARSRCSPTSRKWPAPRRPPGARPPPPPDVGRQRHARRPARPDRSPRRREPLHRRRRRTQAARKSSATNLAKFIESIDAKLVNAAFVDKAPAEVVQQQRDKLRGACAANWHRSKRRSRSSEVAYVRVAATDSSGGSRGTRPTLRL